MPVVNIHLAQRAEPTSREDKAALIDGVTRVMQEVLGKRREDVVVLIHELDPDNWGQGGQTASQLRRERAAGATKR
jgi:4-oxalocrotonate tautomerase